MKEKTVQKCTPSPELPPRDELTGVLEGFRADPKAARDALTGRKITLPDMTSGFSEFNRAVSGISPRYTCPLCGAALTLQVNSHHAADVRVRRV